MKLASDYEKDEHTLTLSGLEASNVLVALTLAVSSYKGSKEPMHREMAEGFSSLQSVLWNELNGTGSSGKK